MTTDSRNIPDFRDIAQLAYGPGGIAKGLAADSGASRRTAKGWYSANRLPHGRILSIAGCMDRRLARLEARLRLYRQHLRREIENAEKREVVARRARDRDAPLAARAAARIRYAPL